MGLIDQASIVWSYPPMSQYTESPGSAGNQSHLNQAQEAENVLSVCWFAIWQLPHIPEVAVRTRGSALSAAALPTVTTQRGRYRTETSQLLFDDSSTCSPASRFPHWMSRHPPAERLFSAVENSHRYCRDR